MEPVLEEGLELALRKINREIAVVEARLQGIARRLGVADWRRLEELLRGPGIDSPEADLLWPEYLYLRRRLEELLERKRRVLELLEG